MRITGAQLFVKALKEEQTKILFAYPGGQAIDLFDALYGQNDIEVVLPRHEQGLVHAADGYARSTGKVGVCLVTSGPGATNLVTGIATANYDSVPLVCFTGQVPTHLIGNDAFQEVDIVGITRSICKYAVTVRDRKDLGTIIKKAFTIAATGRPGVVVVDLPKDIQQAYGDDSYPKDVSIRGYKPSSGVHMGQIKKSLEVLAHAKKPLLLFGGGVKIAHANEEAKQLVELTGIPVVTTIMGKGAIPTDHPLYIGNIGIHGSFAANTAISRCDVLLSVGVRFNDRITGKIGAFAPDAAIIHIDIDPASISRNIVVDIPIVADAKVAIQALLKQAQPLNVQRWIDESNRWNKQHPLAMKATGMTPQKIIERINAMFQEYIVVTDVGQNQLWTTQFLELKEHCQMLTSGGLGTMGYGFPAALGAQLGNPGRDVLLISGDGGMQMNIQEMATAVALELPLILCVFNNGFLGNVRQWQEQFFDRRYSATCLRWQKSCERHCSNPTNDCPPYLPDFVKLAESYGATGVRAANVDEMEAAFLLAKSNRKGPTLIEFLIEPEANVMPIVPPGNPLNMMRMENEDEKKMDMPVCGE